MSTQTADAPDWFRGDQWQNPSPLVQEVAQSQPGVATYGPFNVIQWESLFVSLVNSERVNGIVQWCLDPAGTIVVGTQVFQAEAGVTYLDVLPVVAPYCLVSVTWHSGGGSATETFFLTPIRGSDPWKKPVGNLVLITQPGAVLAGAGGTTNQLALFVTSGKATLAVGTDSTSWVASLYTLTTLGVQAGQLGILGTSIAGPSSLCDVSLPASTAQLTVVNNDAAPRTFRYSLVLSR
jgi:hypothetical protein